GRRLLPGFGRLGGRGRSFVLVVFVFFILGRRWFLGSLGHGLRRLLGLLVILVIRLARDGHAVDHRLNLRRALHHVRRDPEQVAVSALGHRGRERLAQALGHLEGFLERT